MCELRIEAKKENLEKVMAFVDTQLEGMDCPIKAQMQIDIAVEELFINVATYAYEGTGDVLIHFVHDEDAGQVRITFTDSGIPYDPVKKEDPDLTLSADEREIGGLGIYMVKKSMDDMVYRYEDGKNVLTISKRV